MALSNCLFGMQRGRSTNYVVETVGACGFGAYRTIYTMAPNEAVFNNSNVCGTCYEVTGPSGTEIFMAADECPIEGNVQYCSGDVTHFDLDSRAFNNIAPTSVGVTYTSIREIVCPANGNVGVIVDTIGNDYYLPVYIWNHRVPITAVSVQDSSDTTAWTALSRATYNAWVWNPSNAIVYPVNYRVTSVYGETITTSISSTPTSKYQLFTGSAQFTVWPTTVTENACPTFYEYNIFVNGLNDGGDRPTSELWQTTSSANLAYTGTVPSGATVAARMDIAGYSEWYFGTRGTSVPASTIDSVEIWAYSATSVTGMQLAWNNYGDGKIVTLGTVSSTWTKFTFAKSEFGASLTDLDTIRIKNGNSAAVSGFTIAGFRLVPTSSVVVTPTTAGTLARHTLFEVLKDQHKMI